MFAHQHKGHVFATQLPDITKTIDLQGVFRRRRFDARHVANDSTVLLTKWFHKRLVH